MNEDIPNTDNTDGGGQNDTERLLETNRAKIQEMERRLCALESKSGNQAITEQSNSPFWYPYAPKLEPEETFRKDFVAAFTKAGFGQPHQSGDGCLDNGGLAHTHPETNESLERGGIRRNSITRIK